MNPPLFADFSPACPLPGAPPSQVLLAHGGGGRLMQDLLQRHILPALGDPHHDGQHDAAVLAIPTPRIAFTTDSYVVRPLFFPGGDLGSLAVHGTVNDLAMSGARPLYLSAALILEEGLPLEILDRLLHSMRAAADRAGVRIVTGDTKVVDRGKGDGVFVNTAGIGLVTHDLDIGPRSIRPGDAILLSGDLARHGMAVMAVREGLEFESAIESDSAPLHTLVAALLDAGIRPRCLRDVTRGGLTAVLHELALQAQVGLSVRERSIPVRQDVRAACEILGLDPLQVACEGRFVLIVPPADVEAALSLLRNHPSGLASNAVHIGEVLTAPSVQVTLEGQLGIRRLLDRPAGEPLPRIC